MSVATEGFSTMIRALPMPQSARLLHHTPDGAQRFDWFHSFANGTSRPNCAIRLSLEMLAPQRPSGGIRLASGSDNVRAGTAEQGRSCIPQVDAPAHAVVVDQEPDEFGIDSQTFHEAGCVNRSV